MQQTNRSILDNPNNSDNPLNPKLFENIFNKYFTQLCYYARKILRSHTDEANDLVMKAFENLFTSGFILTDENKMKLFLYTTVKRYCIDYIRTNHKTRYFNSELGNDTVDFSLIETELLFSIYEKIKLIPPRARQVLKLSILEDCSTKEIADRLQIKESTVYKHRRRALGQLRSYFPKIGGLMPRKKIENKRLCIRIRDGHLQFIIEQPDNDWISSDNSYTLVNGIYVYTRSRWSIILAELEKLINKPDLKEQELQDFFEAYPELIIDENYSSAIPQATIIKDDKTSWKADFVLVPSDQFTFSKILELKLPNEKISLKSRSGHGDFSKKLFKAINQLKDYYAAFDSGGTKSRFKEKYQTDIFKPDLQLVFGRRNSIASNRDFLELQRRNNLKITDWDTLYEQLKKRYQ